MTEGSIEPKELLAIAGLNATQSYLLKEVQKERQLKQQRYGINNYKSYMEKEKV